MEKSKVFESGVINAMRIPLIILVVFWHNHYIDNAANYSILTGVFNADNPVFYFTKTFIGGGIATSSLLLFFMFAGYYLYHDGYSTDKYIGNVKKRFISLVVPYLLWNAFFILYKLIVLLFFAPPAGIHDPFKLNVQSILCAFWDFGGTGKPIVTPLWFLRDLFIMVLISPALNWIIKKFKFGTVLLFFFIHISGKYPSVLADNGLNLDMMFPFVVGLFCRANGLQLISLPKKLKNIDLLCPLFLIVFCFTAQFQWSRFILHITDVLGTLFLIRLFCRINQTKVSNHLEFLSPYSFFIYTFHAPWAFKLISSLHLERYATSDAMMVIFYLIIPFLVTGICIIAKMVLDKLTPRIAMCLNGQRI